VSALVGARIVTPGDWTDLDLDLSTQHGSIRRAVRRAVAADPALSGNTVRLITMLDDVVRRARDGGAFFCSSLVLGSMPDVLVANVLMQISPDAAELASASAVSVCSGLAAAVSCDAAWAGADVSVVTLPLVGPAVRVELIAHGLCLQYLVPVPGSGRQVVLTFTSPCASYVAALIELFDTMAASFALDFSDDAPAFDGAS
jgi:hypothetical protein